VWLLAAEPYPGDPSSRTGLLMIACVLDWGWPKPRLSRSTRSRRPYGVLVDAGM
jgi:hypothetical protein